MTDAKMAPFVFSSPASIARPLPALFTRSSALRVSLDRIAGERSAGFWDTPPFCISTAVITVARRLFSCSSKYKATCSSRNLGKSGRTMNHAAVATNVSAAKTRDHVTEASLYLKTFIAHAAVATATHVRPTVIAAPRSARLARYRLRTPRTTSRSWDCSEVRPAPCTLSIAPPGICHLERRKGFLIPRGLEVTTHDVL